jgi:hypothetical protein
MDKVTITVAGTAGVGKSSVAGAVVKALLNLGFDVDDSAVCTEAPELKETRYQNISNIVDKVRIVVEEKQLNRQVLKG